MERQKLEWNDELFVLRCRIAAERKGWSLEDLCRQIGANPYFLNKPAPVGRRVDLVVALARAAEVSLDWLCGLDELPILTDPADLAYMSAASNVAAHLYMLMRSQGHAMGSETIVQIVLDLIERKALRPSRHPPNHNSDIVKPAAMMAETVPPNPSSSPEKQIPATSPASRRRPTSQRRSTPR